jgi:hypothetical protein
MPRLSYSAVTPMLSTIKSLPYSNRGLMIALVGLLGFAGSAIVGWLVGIPEPRLTDEFSYLLAADTFAHGRLTNPTHPMWIHFESLHIIQQPTYMSKYPPAQGLILAAGQKIAGHPIFGVWLSFGIMCAAVAWMLYAWVPARWALFGALLTMINPKLGIAGYWAQSYWGGAVAATGGALVLGGVRLLMRGVTALPRSRTWRPRVSYSLITALGLALLANSRPYEGFLIAVPAGAYLLVHIVTQRGPALWNSGRRVVAPIVIVLALTVSAMGYYNFRITGNPFHLPYQVHEETYAVAPLFLWQAPNPTPVYRHNDIRDYHTSYVVEGYQAQLSIPGFLQKLSSLFWSSILQFLNVFLVPLLGIFTLLLRWTLRNDWARFALVSYAVLLCGLLLEVHWAIHYLAPMIALNYFFIVTAVRLWRRRYKQGGRMMLWLVPSLAAAMLVASLHTGARQNQSSAWNVQRAKLIAQLQQQGGRHLILVSYATEDFRHPVWEYNEANIDAAKVVWARTMDRTQNCKLLDYFRDRQLWSLEIHGEQSRPTLALHPAKLCS